MFLRWDGQTASQLPFLYPHCHLSHTLRKRNVMKITCKHIPPAQEVQRFFQVYFKNQEEFSYFPPPSPEHSSEHHRAAYSLEKTKPLSKEQQERAQTHWPQGAVPTCGPWRMSPQVGRAGCCQCKHWTTSSWPLWLGEVPHKGKRTQKTKGRSASNWRGKVMKQLIPETIFRHISNGKIITSVYFESSLESPRSHAWPTW